VPSRIPTRLLLLGGIAGPVLFVLAILVEGATRPDYDPVRQYVSLLSLGDGGWAQVVNFIASGVLVAGFGAGLGRIWRDRRSGRWTARLVIAVGLALIWSGVFLPDPSHGYPPGQQGLPAGAFVGVPTNPTWHALLHFGGSAAVFVGLAAAGLLTARRGTRWHGPAARVWTICCVVTAAIVLGSWVSGLVLGGANDTSPTAGLLQRISIVAGMQWLVVTAAIELRGRSFRGASPALA
jgi:protein-S-isoprenylcysteine O-methyltransferase Ste14